MSLKDSAAREHVVFLYTMVAALVIVTLFLGTVVGNLRDRTTRTEQRLLRHDVDVECLRCPDLPAAYRRANCQRTCP